MLIVDHLLVCDDGGSYIAEVKSLPGGGGDWLIDCCLVSLHLLPGLPPGKQHKKTRLTYKQQDRFSNPI